MRSAALKKEYVQDNFQPAVKAAKAPSAVRVQSIAEIAEEACNLPDNLNSPDFEAFTVKYRLKTTFA